MGRSLSDQLHREARPLDLSPRPVSREYDAATDTATLDPTSSLQRRVTYKAVVTTGAKDAAGNSLNQNSTVTVPADGVALHGAPIEVDDTLIVS